MKNKILIAATSAALLFSAANSFATDFSVSPNVGAIMFSEPADVKDIGKISKDLVSTDLKLADSFTDKLNYSVGIDIFYCVATNVDLGIGASYFFSPSIKLSGTGAQVFTAPVVQPYDYKAQPTSVEFKPDVFTLMAKASVNYDVSFAKIGLTGGVGASRIKQTVVYTISMVDVAGTAAIPGGAAAIPTTYKAAQTATVAEKNAQYNLAWQIGADVNLEVAPGVGIKVGGGYMSLGKTSEADSSNTIGTATAIDSKIPVYEYKGPFITLGVNISL